MKNRGTKGFISVIMVLSMVLAGALITAVMDPAGDVVYAEPEGDVPVYTLNAEPVPEETGVYRVEANVGDNWNQQDPSTIGIPSVAKQTLANGPTTESPAIIMGAAVNYEKKTGPTEYTPIEGAKLIAPYSYFRWSVIDEKVQNEDGTISVHKKLSGFDGSYYIIRVDVSRIIEGKTGYLHVRQDDNKALMAVTGLEGTSFSNAMGSKTASYSLANNAAALKDSGADDADKDTPYVDVIVLSSGKLTAGADAGKDTAPSPNIKLSFYVDKTKDYDPKLKPLDPNNLPKFPYKAKNGKTYKTEQAYNNAMLGRFFNKKKMTEANNATSYLVMGEDLEIDVTVDEQEEIGAGDTPAEFWSLTKAMDYQPYNAHIIKLICEVPVLEGLSIDSKVAGEERSVFLDVNSFDIQIANNTQEAKAGLTIAGGASLRIMDGTKTSGAELAIGNNATMVIKKGGALIIDESCTGEVEYDAATTPSGSSQKPEEMAVGEITVEDGGCLVNRGVVSIEGAEAKPQVQKVTTDIKRADMFIDFGGAFENYGCLSLKGDLFVLGTLNNYGQYNDTFDAHDPDKGTITYHRGIQVTWKDNVTKKGVEPGALNVGIDADGRIENRAVLNNYGDIVLVPGKLNLYGTLNNAKHPDDATDHTGHIYLCMADQAIIPITPTKKAPLVVEKRVYVDPPKSSVLNSSNGTVNGEDGSISEARVELIHNGVLGELIPLTDEEAAARAAYAKKVKTAMARSARGLKAKAKKGKKARLTWKKASGASGYKIKYCRKKNFKKGVKTVTVSKVKTKTKTIRKLKAKKYYYFKIAPYTKVKNPTTGKTRMILGKWSKAKRIKARR